MQTNPLHLLTLAKPVSPVQSQPGTAIFPIETLLLLPLILGLSIIGHRQHRATILQRRVKQLERLWMIDVPKNSR